MKILKIFGIVVGIHLFALILIFANPGCNSTTRSTPAPIERAAHSDAATSISVPNTSPRVSVPLSATSDGSAPVLAAAPIRFNPDAPATAVGGGAAGVRFTPTRPGSPAATVLQPEAVTGVTPVATYTVRSGDSLWTIAKKHHVTVAKIAAANNLKPSATLKDGQKLIIPSATAPAPSVPATPPNRVTTGAATPKPTADGMKHVVRTGESLSAIAQRYGVKAGDIAVANNISDPQKIQAGTELIIPGWQPASAKNGKAKSAKGGKATPPPAPPADTPTIFSTPDQTTGAGFRPTPGADVPVIRVEDTPPPKNP